MAEPPVSHTARRVAFIHRSQTLSSRRGIYNLEELLHVATAWGADSFTIEFEDMTLLQQARAARDESLSARRGVMR